MKTRHTAESTALVIMSEHQQKECKLSSNSCMLLQGGDLQDSDGHSSFERFVCGLCAGTLAKLTTHPLDVAKKRFQVAGLPRDAR